MAYNLINDVWNQPSRLYPEFDVNTIEYAIGGKMVSTRIIIQDHEQTHFKSDDKYRAAIKTRLAVSLAEYMVAAGMIEFTHLPQPHDGTTIIHARCYVAPDSQVKILRTKVPNGF